MADHTQSDDGDEPSAAFEYGIGWIRGHALVRGNYVLVAVRVVARRKADAQPREFDTAEVLRYAIALANRLADAHATPRRLDVEAVVDIPDSDAVPLWEELRVYGDVPGVDQALLGSVATEVLGGAGTFQASHLVPGAKVVAKLVRTAGPSVPKRPSTKPDSQPRAVVQPPAALPTPAPEPAAPLPSEQPVTPPVSEIGSPKVRRLGLSRQTLVGSVLIVVIGLAAVATLEWATRLDTSEIAGVQAEPTLAPTRESTPVQVATASAPVVAKQLVVAATPSITTPTQPPAATPTAPATATPSPAVVTPTAPAVAASPAASASVPRRTLLDFAAGQTSSLPWPNDRNSIAWLAPDGYHLVVQQPGRFVAIGLLSEQVRDVLVTATFRKTGGPAGGGYGIILRDPGPAPRDGLSQGGNYLILEVGDRGEVGVWRRADDRWVDVLPWTPAASVRPALGDNTLEIRALGDRLTMSVNGTEVASTVDTAPVRGRVGVFLGGDQNEALLTRLTIQSLE
jgi:hypothetical protein